MKRDELIDKILSDLYLNSNRALDFYDSFYVYESDINKLDEVKSIMESEGLIKIYKNLKAGISPLGFKICFDGGYLEENFKKDRQTKRAFLRNKHQIEFLRKKLRYKKRMNIFLVLLLTSSIVLIMLVMTGIINIRLNF